MVSDALLSPCLPAPCLVCPWSTVTLAHCAPSLPMVLDPLSTKRVGLGPDPEQGESQVGAWARWCPGDAPEGAGHGLHPAKGLRQPPGRATAGGHQGAGAVLRATSGCPSPCCVPVTLLCPFAVGARWGLRLPLRHPKRCRLRATTEALVSPGTSSGTPQGRSPLGSQPRAWDHELCGHGASWSSLLWLILVLPTCH